MVKLLQCLKSRNKLLLSFLLLWTFSIPLRAADDVDDYDRLSLLRQATGGQPSANGYQARLDAILNPNPDAARTVVAADDAKNRAQARENASIQAAITTARQPKLYDDTRVKGRDENLKVTGKVDGSEKTFQKSLSEMLQSPEKEKKPEQKPSSTTSLEEKEKDQKSKLPPDLADNPFYKGVPEEPDPAKKFEADKPVIVSRLVATTDMHDLDAQNFVDRASNAEELIILLMQEKGLSYEEANETVTVNG